MNDPTELPLSSRHRAVWVLGLLLCGAVGVRDTAAQSATTATIRATATVVAPVQARVLSRAIARIVRNPESRDQNRAVAYSESHDGADVRIVADRPTAHSERRTITIAFVGT